MRRLTVILSAIMLGILHRLRLQNSKLSLRLL